MPGNALETELLMKMRPFHARWEGEKLVAYICPAGFLTIGIGHNCEASPVPGITRAGNRIDEDDVERLYAEDCRKTFAGLDRHLPWWRQLDAPRAAVLFDMAFNMGIGFPPSGDKRGKGLRSFVNTLEHIRNGRYVAASLGMRESKWCADVKGRADVMIKQMVSGEWQV